jgi:hypothetical protein
MPAVTVKPIDPGASTQFVVTELDRLGRVTRPSVYRHLDKDEANKKAAQQAG